MKGDVYPAKENVFRAFRETPFDDVKITIVGQDCYHGGEATGLAFANDNKKLVPSPSLRNILQEVEDDCYDGFDFSRTTNFELTDWASQGVFLINMALTVRKNEPGSHVKEWKFFTDAVIKELNDSDNGRIFMLWGSVSQQLEKLIDGNRHHILKAAHPAVSCYGGKGWFGCKHFTQANTILERLNGSDAKIKW
jgi:uracil-DNA glycosylase